MADSGICMACGLHGRHKQCNGSVVGAVARQCRCPCRKGEKPPPPESPIARHFRRLEEQELKSAER